MRSKSLNSFDLGLHFSLVIFVLCFLCFSCFLSTVEASQPISQVSSNSPEYYWAKSEIESWEQRILQALESEELPVFWAKRGRFEKVLNHSNPPSAALYVAAEKCTWGKPKERCDVADFEQLLINTDPENAAVYLIRFTYGQDVALFSKPDFTLVTKRNLDLLRLASEATHFNQYAGRESASRAKAIRKLAVDISPPTDAAAILIEAYPGYGFPQFESYEYPVERLIWLEVTRWNESYYGALTQLCFAIARSNNEAGRAYCELISDLMIYKSRSKTTSWAGYKIKSTLFADEEPYGPKFKSWDREYRDEIYIPDACSSPTWMASRRIPNGGWEDLDEYYEDLQEFGPIDATRLAIEREWQHVNEKLPEQIKDCQNAAVIESYRINEVD